MDLDNLLQKQIKTDEQICFGTFPSSPKEDEISNQPHRVQLETAVKLRYGAIIVSWVSVVVALAQGVIAMVLASKNNSQSLFGFGLDALLDCLTSIVVLWRFYSKDLYSETKERRACLTIACLFILMALFLCGKSIHALVDHSLAEKSIDLLNFTLIEGVINLILACVKVYIGYKLESRALMIDSVVTFVGMVMCFAALGATELYIRVESMWFMDSALGIVCGVFLTVLAIKLIYDNIHPGNSETEAIIHNSNT